MDLVDNLIKDGWLKTPRIIKAFREIKRQDFLLEKEQELAELNEALPIGFGQTISQPLTVAFMMELLQPEQGDKILDIGAGSGWTTALLAHIVGEKGKVIAIEIIPELKKFGENNASKYNFIKKGIVEFICADGSKGYQKEAPFDKILVSASAKKIPESYKEQIKSGGRIVIPIEPSIWLFKKTTKKKSGFSIKEKLAEFETKEYPGFVFVPLIEK